MKAEVAGYREVIAQHVMEAGLQDRHSDSRAHVLFPRELQASGGFPFQLRKVRLPLSTVHCTEWPLIFLLCVLDIINFTTLRTHFIFSFEITVFHCRGAL